MIQSEFDQILRNVLSIIDQKAGKKGEEYGRADRLHNFKKGARRRGKIPEEVLLDFQEKHNISIDDLIEDLKQGKEHEYGVWVEKVTDQMVYGVCLLALIYERTISQTCAEDAPRPTNGRAVPCMEKPHGKKK